MSSIGYELDSKFMKTTVDCIQQYRKREGDD